MPIALKKFWIPPVMLVGGQCPVGWRNVAFLSGQRQAGRLNTELAAEIFGLSRSESEVCGMVLDGLAPEQIEKRRVKSVRTIRNQLQAEFDKVDVASQRELFLSI